MLIARHGMHRVSTVRRKSTVSMVNMRHSLCITNLKISRSKPWTVQGPEIRKMVAEKVPGNTSLGTDFIADPDTLCMTHTELCRSHINKTITTLSNERSEWKS